MQALREQFNEMHSSKCQVQADLQALKNQYEQDLERINSQVGNFFSDVILLLISK